MPMKIIYILSMVLLLSACASSPEARQRKMEERIRVTQRVHDQIADQHFRINVSMMHPQRYPAKMLTSPYYFEVLGDSVVSYLPYMGRAYNVPYGGGKALNFEGRVVNRDVQQVNPSQYLMVLDIDNDEALYRYTISAFDNGASTIDIYTRERESISFIGQMDVER